MRRRRRGRRAISRACRLSGGEMESLLGKSVRTSTAASTLAGLSRLGLSEERSEITLRSCWLIEVSVISSLGSKMDFGDWKRRD